MIKCFIKVSPLIASGPHKGLNWMTGERSTQLINEGSHDKTQGLDFGRIYAYTDKGSRLLEVPPWGDLS